MFRSGPRHVASTDRVERCGSLTCVRSFEQKDVLRVVKALASFRPSLIALQWVTWAGPATLRLSGH
jgi:hypothetical protein